MDAAAGAAEEPLSMPKPLTDLVAFLTADTTDYDALGAAKYVVLLVFCALILASLTLFVVNLRDERAQRSGRLLWLWLIRVLVGCMWFQATLWTLPFGTGNGLFYWTQQVAGRAALPQLAQFAADVLLPRFSLFDPLVYLAEFGLATAFILGLFVRLAGLVSLVAGLTLWLGLYGQRPGDPAQWPWGFVFLAMLGGTFAVFAAGRAMGADAWIRRNVVSVRERRPAGLLLRLLT